MTAWGLKGVFTPLGWQVAGECGVEVSEVEFQQSDEFQSLVTLAMSSDGRELSVSGTLFADGDSRIVPVDGFRVDAIPHGRRLVTRIADVPGVIGLIGSVMGEFDLNIAGMSNARENVGDAALTVCNVD